DGTADALQVVDMRMLCSRPVRIEFAFFGGLPCPRVAVFQVPLVEQKWHYHRQGTEPINQGIKDAVRHFLARSRSRKISPTILVIAEHQHQNDVNRGE